jgi:F-type H+-transporting ATPase subunit alpha
LPSSVPVEEQVLVLFAGVRGYLDGIELGKIGAFERQMLSELHSREPALVAAIRDDREIKPDTEKKLIAFMDNFTKSFA